MHVQCLGGEQNGKPRKSVGDPCLYHPTTTCTAALPISGGGETTEFGCCSFQSCSDFQLSGGGGKGRTMGGDPISWMSSVCMSSTAGCSCSIARHCLQWFHHNTLCRVSRVHLLHHGRWGRLPDQRLRCMGCWATKGSGRGPGKGGKSSQKEEGE